MINIVSILCPGLSFDWKDPDNPLHPQFSGSGNIEDWSIMEEVMVFWGMGSSRLVSTFFLGA